MSEEKSNYISKCIKKYGSTSIRKIFWYASLEHPHSGVRLSNVEVSVLARMPYKVVNRLLIDDVAPFPKNQSLT